MQNGPSPLISLNNGSQMPQFGLGVWKASDNEAEFAVTTALEAGYRLIDTAAVYGNEVGVGRGIAGANVPRSDIFVTTKLWNADQGYDSTLKAFELSLERLRLDYIDLYLIHWPIPAVGTYLDTWKAFERLQQEGTVKSIGVSNFPAKQLEDLLVHAEVSPVVNQIELHPWFAQRELRQYCAEHDIVVESWSPIGQGGALLDEPVLQSIAEAHGKTPAQVVIRWHIQHGLVVIPKSVNESRIRENVDVFDFELSADEMEKVDAMETGRRLGPDPATANFK